MQCPPRIPGAALAEGEALATTVHRSLASDTTAPSTSLIRDFTSTTPPAPAEAAAASIVSGPRATRASARADRSAERGRTLREHPQDRI
jgi:hypothetical protein